MIDVSELLLDPDFIDPIQIIRRLGVVDQYGMNVLTETEVVSTVASVQPASNTQIQRLPELLRIADVRAFYIKTEVTIDSASEYPDIIVYKTRRFQIMSAEPWTNFGAGWNLAIAVAEKVT